LKSAERIFSDAVARLGTNDFGSAEKLFAKVLKLQPGHVPTLLNLAITQLAQKRPQDAQRTLEVILRRDPDNVDANLMLSRLLLTVGNFQQALRVYDNILRATPSILEVHCNRAGVLNELGRYEDAVSSALIALKIDPSHAPSHLNYGNALFNLGRYEESCVAYRRALAVDPAHVGSLLGLANALVELGRRHEALGIYDRLLERQPSLPPALVGRANLYFDLARPQDALADYDRALAVRPDTAEAWMGRGNVLSDLKSYGEAVAAYDQALRHDSGLDGIEGMRLFARMNLCDWTSYQSDCDRLIQSVRNKRYGAAPWAFLAIPSTAADQLRCAKAWNARKYPPTKAPLWRGEKYRHDKIRIGYVSADFHEHPTSYLMAGLFERHTRSRFEVTAFSLGLDDGSAMRRRLERAFDHFVDARVISDEEIAAAIREQEIDLLVDLQGYTKSARTGIFARRPAPIQVNYLGYPGTLGADYIDYLIADRTLVSREDEAYYAEKIACLPHSYQPNDDKREISSKIFARAECGLPEDVFVYCCFNNSFKISPSTFDYWMEILKQAKDSVLWLLEGDTAATTNLRKEASARGIDPQRLIFAKRLPAPDHLARHRLADLVLDSLPCNAHTTASDALWTGVPVLTLVGETFAGRVAASLLKAVGLPEMVVHSPAQYVRLAIEMAQDPACSASIKEKLARNRLTAPLFDTRLFTLHIEAAYEEIYRRQQAGLPPDHIEIGAVENSH
jgi:protein O-GlcNAc transferase